MKVPILFIIFNRADIAFLSFQQIKEYKPTDLYIAADGPRANKKGEKTLCDNTRKAIIDAIDWDCNVHTLFKDKNEGVDKGVYSAINWMFETEKWGVIIEDDCILSLDFFRLCEEAFVKYEQEERIVHIAANNTNPSAIVSPHVDLYQFPMSWGWATWRDKWNKVMNPEMPGIKRVTYWNTVRKFGFVMGIMFHKYWLETYKRRYELKTWDSIWQYSVMMNDNFSLMPNVNLALNNGIGTSEGSHYKVGDKNYFADLELGRLEFPLIWPDKLYVKPKSKKHERRSFASLRFWGFKNKILSKFQ